MAQQKAFPWQDKINHHSQMGGIETSVQDNGPARGVRIAWINTGSGLRYKVAIDRGLDIMDAFYQHHSLAFISHLGLNAPRPDAHQGLEWLSSFGGGLLTTCGLTHVGAPDNDEGRGLHGRISNQPAEVESIIQPDPAQGKLDFSLTAVIKESRVYGPCLELRRTISGCLGEPAIRIKDIVTNRGPAPAPHMILYHINFGWPLVDEGADIVYRGQCQSRGEGMDDAIFNSQRNYRRCPSPMDGASSPEGCGYIEAVPDAKGICRAGVANAKIPLAVVIEYTKKQMPCLTNWQHCWKNEYLTAVEPGTNFPTGQAQARRDKKLITLRPGQSRTYEFSLTVLADKREVEKFIKTGGEK